MDWLREIDSDWTLFLDRDGVINERVFGGYVLDREGFHFLPGVKEALAYFSQKFNYIFVVTNQQGIGKGLMEERNLLDIHRYMLTETEKAGGRITACYFAPELKSDENHTRKPKTTMALKAKADFPEIDFRKSIMVGDTDTDILFGKNNGMKTVRVLTEEPVGIEADLAVESLLRFKELCEKY